MNQLDEILLVEDNPADQRLAIEALKETGWNCHVTVIGDGASALNFLHRLGEYCNAPTPQLIILDLNIPKKSGRQVLGEIKEDPLLRQIPVVVLSSSESDEDVTACYNLHCNCYISKPTDLDNFFAIVRDIEKFWLGDVRLPKSPAALASGAW